MWGLVPFIRKITKRRMLKSWGALDDGNAVGVVEVLEEVLPVDCVSVSLSTKPSSIPLVAIPKLKPSPKSPLLLNKVYSSKKWCKRYSLSWAIPPQAFYPPKGISIYQGGMFSHPHKESWTHHDMTIMR
ncbi:hypothetical protein DEO72_LG5g2228 [Vigna unguiculata]|uniref:Uncharacterized protein n=1 Tax=Vigna unguiculata TaxID=3917 RepID=A0A4D6M0N4_VIGUN|nr:hypothetical protein DEO72_LG5g2228 [Vigna unguiculata]